MSTYLFCRYYGFQYLQHYSTPVQDEAKYFFLFESLSQGLAYLVALFFKMSLLLSYKSTSLRKKHHFLRVFRVIELYIRFSRLQRRILKKGPRGRLAFVTSFQTKKRNHIYNEGTWRFFGAQMTYF